MLPGSLVERLKRVGRETNHTLFNLIFTAFGLLAHRHSGRNDLLLLSADAGRTMHETEGMIGMFAHPLLVRAAFSSDPSFTTLLGQVRSEFTGAAAHPLPVAQLIERFAPDRNGRPPVLSQLFFDSLPDLPVTLNLQGIRAATYFPTAREKMRHDLEFYIRPVPDGLYCALWCSLEVFEPAAPDRMMQDFSVLLARIAENPDARVSALTEGIAPLSAGPVPQEVTWA